VLSFAEALRRLLDKLLGVVRAVPAERLELLALHLVVRHEEVLKLPQERIAQILERADVRVVERASGDGDEAVVPLGLTPALGLLRLDHAHKAGRHLAPGRHRLVQQHEDVERVAVVALGRGTTSTWQNRWSCSWRGWRGRSAWPTAARKGSRWPGSFARTWSSWTSACRGWTATRRPAGCARSRDWRKSCSS